jgi:hypothetical protein
MIAMSAEPEPTPPPQPPADASLAAEPPPDSKADQAPQSEQNLYQELKVATRNGRYALVTAVAAAIVSSFVSAGAAVYVGVTQSNRADRLAASQALTTDRQKVYHDFSASIFNYVQGLAALQAHLQAHHSKDSVGSAGQALAQLQTEFMASANLLSMDGSPEMQELVGPFEDDLVHWTYEQFNPLFAKYLWPGAPAADDTVGWERDSAALANSIQQLLVKIGQFDDAFVGQGRKDLQ